jgi:hypothetical protein
MDSLIAGTLILTGAFLLRFPAPLKQLSPNLVLHFLLLSAYFSAHGALFFAENLAPLGAVATLEHLQLALVVILYAVWAICLSPNGSTSESWPRLDTAVVELVEQRNRAALALLRYAADK